MNRKIPERQLTQRVFGGFAAWTDNILLVFNWTRQRTVRSVFLELCVRGESTFIDDPAGELSRPYPPNVRRNLLFPPVATRINNKVLLVSLFV